MMPDTQRVTLASPSARAGSSVPVLNGEAL